MSGPALRNVLSHRSSELSAGPENEAGEAFRVEKKDRAAKLAALPV